MRYLCYLLLILLTVSCASLKIEVDTYKGDIFPFTDQSRFKTFKVMNRELFNSDIRGNWFHSFLEELKDDFYQIQKANYLTVLPRMDKNKDKTSAQIDSMAVANVKDNWFGKDGNSGISLRIKEEWTKYDQKLENVHKAAKNANDVINTNTRNTLSGEALEKYRVFQSEYEVYISESHENFLSFVRDIQKLLGSQVEGIEVADYSTTASLKEMVRTPPGIASSEDVKGKMVGYPIFDPNITTINRNDSVWDNFNTTVFRSQLGNSQFVAVREGLLVFHKKGLDFDPTPIIGAGTATAKLGIKVAGALASGSTGNLFEKPTAQNPDHDSNERTILYDSEIELMNESLVQRNNARKKMLAELARLLERLEKDNNYKVEEAKKEYERIIYFYFGQISLNKE